MGRGPAPDDGTAGAVQCRELLVRRLEHVQNSTLANTQVKTLICPSESQAVGPHWSPSWTNYAANFGGPSPIMAWSGALPPWPAAAWTTPTATSGRTVSQIITDGTSNTACFGEKLVGLSSTSTITLGSGTSGDALRVAFQVQMTISADMGNSAQALQLLQACKALPSSTAAVPAGVNWYTGGVWHGTHDSTLRFNSYNHFNTPNGLTCIDTSQGDTQAPGDFSDALTATSNHPGGVNIGFCDGSVHFVKNTINLQTWWALGSRNLGEIIDASSY